MSGAGLGPLISFTIINRSFCLYMQVIHTPALVGSDPTL